MWFQDKFLLPRKKWPILLAWLLLANVGYFIGGILGWSLTLSFFLFVPGYLLFITMRHQVSSRWEVLSFSLGLSLLFLMLVGLLLSSLHYLGLPRPLESLYIFTALDIFSLLFIFLRRNEPLRLTKITPTKSHVWFCALVLLLPLLAAGGAIRINNGASNILTMVLFGLIAVLFLFLIWRKDLRNLYPLALFSIALAVLFTISLRGWGITGHDIMREFYVFQLTAQNGFWDIAAFRDPYNACLSITILPVMFMKLTAITDAYIFKVVFQIIFAFSVIPIYCFIKRLSNERLALMGTFLFISFPTFLNDMPMLNRQEISFVFFSLLMLLALVDMARPHKKLLTVLLLFGSVISHYSSSYVVLGILLGAWAMYFILTKMHKKKVKETFVILQPTLNITIILVALLLIFLWNSQITATTAGLQKTVNKTWNSLVGKPAAQATDVNYSLFGSKPEEPQTLLDKHVAAFTNGNVTVRHVPSDSLPLTTVGTSMNGTINIEAFHKFVRNATAKFLQVMLLIGCVVLFLLMRRKPNQLNTYFMALTLACIIFLILQTLLPQLSVDYGTLRLFQQELIILALPTLMGMTLLFSWLPRFKTAAVSGILVFLFLHLSGFIPQLTGGYPPQLALNNSGFYYDSYYLDEGEKKAADWLMDTKQKDIAVAVDLYALLRFTPDAKNNLVLTSPFVDSKRAYVYKDRANMRTGAFIANINSNLYYYSVSRSTALENQIYSNNTGGVSKLVPK